MNPGGGKSAVYSSLLNPLDALFLELHGTKLNLENHTTAGI